MVWKVGDGRGIRVFRDRWVGGLNGELLAERPSEGDDRAGGVDSLRGSEAGRGEMRVEELLEGGAWDEAKLLSNFTEREVRAILATPIVEHGAWDEVRWRYDEKGKFSVKSAYLLEMGYYDGETHMSGGDRKFWGRMVWNLSVPPKVRVFAWRVYSNLIPTAGNLLSHHVPSEGICSLCKDRWSSTEHALLFCPRVRNIWKASRFWGVMRRAKFLQTVDVGEAVRKELGEGEYEVWVVMMWKVWSAICRVNHDSTDTLPNELEADSVALWEMYQHARHALLPAVTMGMKLGKKEWSPPCKGLLRVDVDASFKPERNRFGVGIIVRDCNGEVRLAVSKPMKPHSSAGMAEVMAIIHGIVACLEHEVGPVEIHTDSMFAARVFANPGEEHELLPDDICDIIKAARDNMLIGVCHMYRSANKAAHCLAKAANECSQPRWWKKDFPRWLVDIVKGDCP